MRCQSVCDIWDSWDTGCWDTPPVEPRRGSYVARAPPPRVHLGREPINLEWSADVRFGAHNGLKSDIALWPKSAKLGSRRVNHVVQRGRLLRTCRETDHWSGVLQDATRFRKTISLARSTKARKLAAMWRRPG